MFIFNFAIFSCEPGYTGDACDQVVDDQRPVVTEATAARGKKKMPKLTNGRTDQVVSAKEEDASGSNGKNTLRLKKLRPGLV